MHQKTLLREREEQPPIRFPQATYAERSTEVGWTIIDRTERIIEPIEPTTDGPGGAPAAPEPPPCFRLRRYGRRVFQPNCFSAEKIFGRKFFRPNVASTTVDAEVVFFLIISKNLPRGQIF